jgi:hypothetical protein
MPGSDTELMLGELMVVSARETTGKRSRPNDQRRVSRVFVIRER